MVLETGKPIAEVARELGIHDGTLGNWVQAWRRDHPDPDQPLTPVEQAQMKEMQDEDAAAVREDVAVEDEEEQRAAARKAREWAASGLLITCSITRRGREAARSS